MTAAIASRRSSVLLGAALGATALLLGSVAGSFAQSSAPSSVPASQAPARCAPTPALVATPSVATDAVGPTVSVAAASDLRHAMDALVATYRAQHPDRGVAITYGSSGNFLAQISQGAPFDVFFSADIAYPRELEAAGLAAPGATRPYAEGRIVVWVQDASPIDVDALGIAAVLDPAAQRVAIANPEHAPYGRAAQSAMAAAGVWAEVQPRIVLGENVSQAAQFVESGAADVGILALSLAIAPPLCQEGRSALVPQSLHPAIDQGAVVLTGAADPAAAQAFLDFVLGPEGRVVLDRYGFLLPEA